MGKDNNLVVGVPCLNPLFHCLWDSVGEGEPFLLFVHFVCPFVVVYHHTIRQYRHCQVLRHWWRCCVVVVSETDFVCVEHHFWFYGGDSRNLDDVPFDKMTDYFL